VLLVQWLSKLKNEQNYIEKIKGNEKKEEEEEE